MARLAWLLLCTQLAACIAYREPEVPAEPASAAPASLGVARLAEPLPGAHGNLSAGERKEFLGRLQEDLAGTGLFERVVLGVDVPADVVVVAEYEQRRCSAETLATIVTIGIVPSPGCYISGYVLTLTGPALPGGSVHVGNRSEPLALWGWVAGPMRLLPGWSAELPRTEEAAALRAAILLAIASRE